MLFKVNLNNFEFRPEGVFLIQYKFTFYITHIN